MTIRKSYSIPAMEIVGFDFLLNQHNRRYISDEYKSTLSSIRRNLGTRWVVDDNPFSTNQLGHPYQGSIYHGFARSAGLNYWEALGYTFAGSAFWEVAGETTSPSRNDQIMTGIGGTFLGEALFRLSSLMLEHGNGDPPLWREIGAAALSPSASFNRLVFGNRFGGIFPGVTLPITAASRLALAAPQKTSRAPPAPSSGVTRRSRISLSTMACPENRAIPIRGHLIISICRRLRRAPMVSKTL